MSIEHVSMGFADASDPELDAITENIIQSMTGNPSFATPIVPMTELKTALDTFTTAMSAAADGGKQATAAKNAARAILVDLLRREASYVQLTSHNDLAMLLASGFDAASQNRGQSPLDQPAITEVLNEGSAQLVLRVTPVTNARAYDVRHSSAPGVWQNGTVSTKARRIVVGGLTPGITYTLQVRAVGGSTGYSNWSEAISHMAI